eukprot:TRINITY_DN3287_c0_g3_i6.p2 TRINITY_DN3287_c0_g3~~TRINITY_DN3287_c0_g3_i6.p2  ORF type:complete len:153 (-),score=43.61 TRINITY_DN3287_c0_g3_i6:231-689(-)
MPEDLLRFCRSVCGERGEQYLAHAVKHQLAPCLGFEHSYVLHYSCSRLLALNYFQSSRELIVENPAEIPSTMGLTGQCIAKQQIVVSNKGKDDIGYNAPVDNVMKLGRVENVMMVPLLVERKEGKECVGVLQLINNRLGDAGRVDEVVVLRV